MEYYTDYMNQAEMEVDNLKRSPFKRRCRRANHSAEVNGRHSKLQSTDECENRPLFSINGTAANLVCQEKTASRRAPASCTRKQRFLASSSSSIIHSRSAFLTAFTCFFYVVLRCNAVNVTPRFLDPGPQTYPPQQQTSSNAAPYSTNGNNNVVLSYNNNNNGGASGPPVVEPDYSSYLHWFFYFSPITLSWLSSNIVPDLIAVPPPLPLLVGFDSKAAVYWGNDLAPSLVRNQPVFMHWPTQPGMLYTIVMAVPDVLANEKPSVVLWVVVNIPGTRVDRGDVIVEYPGAAPPRDTGKHRYVFLVFKQTSRIHTSGYPEVTRRQFENRANFDFHHFAMHFKLGYPIAGNFFLSEYDDYVPFIYKQLGI